MSKNKPADPFTQYLNSQVSHWKDRIEDIEDDIAKYKRRQAACQQQLAFYRVKLKALSELKTECRDQLDAAEETLTKSQEK